MTIYYFKKDIERTHYHFGNGKEEYHQTAESLIKSAESFIEGKLTAKEIKSITSMQVPDYDYYAVQGYCDGFGNDTYTVTCFLSLKEAENYVSNHKYYQVVGQWFGKEYRNYWE